MVFEPNSGQSAQNANSLWIRSLHKIYSIKAMDLKAFVTQISIIA
jgi:hypothetical protein